MNALDPNWEHEIRNLVFQHLNPHREDLICLIREAHAAITFLQSVETSENNIEVNFIIEIYRDLVSYWELIL